MQPDDQPPPAGEGRTPREVTHAVQRDVADFHRALDIEIGQAPAIRRPELRAELIREEARETVEAIERGDLVEAIDGMCDLLCVTYGTALEFGVNLAPYWDEVHRTNMAKQGGPVREDGKRLKPPGWTPPDIAGLLARDLAGEPLPSSPDEGERGGERALRALLEVEVGCPDCWGTGELESEDSTDDRIYTCGRCRGRGRRPFAEAFADAARVVQQQIDVAPPSASPVEDGERDARENKELADA